MNIIESIDKWAKTNTDKIAFQWRNEQLTYGDLYERSNCLASWILNNLKDDHSPVIVYGHMQSEMIISFLAAVKAGHPYIPVDISTPNERIKKIIEFSGATLIIAMEDVSEITSEFEIEVLNKAQIHSICQENRISEKLKPVQADDNFYIIYTSGSTGDPKGVQITHSCLSSFVTWMQNDFSLKGENVFLNQAPFSFDLSVMDLYPALVSGSTLFAVDKDMIAKPKELFEALKESNISVWVSTPSFAEMCLMDQQFSQELLPKLHTFLFCGEVLTNDCANRLIARFPNATVYNTYGPTEATVAVTSIPVTKEVLAQYAPLPVGYCKADCEILIMDQDGNIVPDGEKGEIVIVGPSVSVGYLGNTEKTQQAFTTINGQRAYKTGDSGYLENGLLFFGGRKDFQIKLHGYRMELEDIENNLRKVSFVKGAFVVPKMNGGKCEYLTAVVIPNEHKFEKEFHLTQAIKAELGEYLPSYMIPRKFVYRDDVPMTNNGKIDRKQLLEGVLV